MKKVVPVYCLLCFLLIFVVSVLSLNKPSIEIVTLLFTSLAGLLAATGLLLKKYIYPSLLVLVLLYAFQSISFVFWQTHYKFVIGPGISFAAFTTPDFITRFGIRIFDIAFQVWPTESYNSITVNILHVSLTVFFVKWLNQFEKSSIAATKQP
ncbi:hypothetical protein AM493_14085 [Flavobacterium akiainvivens]|uniref:Uncharacterized protein n=1 Tax=Flavobacterium akiainvivens TaxID=1202724 RepID=A0A0M8MC37_9FLAO|nr:hypothetical protein AM493_14085 [Flavobacterium akiainvivens]SFQ58917.1 hypothetical protein SAMN05444144_10956 [Flavobacterium akiainvivens]